MFARFPAALAVALALALLPASASAASSKRTKATSTKKPAATGAPATAVPAESPAAGERATSPSSYVAPAPLPPPSPGMSVISAPTPNTGFRVAGLVGLASPQGNGGDGSLMVQAEASQALRTTGAGVTLSWALPFRGVVLSGAKAAGLEAGGYALEATPTARASMPLGRSKLSLRADAGLGVVARWTWTQVDVTYIGRVTETSQDTTGILRLGVALEYALRPDVALVCEPLTFGWDFDGNADWIFAGGVSYRL